MAHGEDVEVKFGASIEGLTAGVNRGKEEIESLRAPVENFVESLKGVAEAAGAAFVVEKLADWVKEIAEGAEKLDIMADAIGTTASKLSELGSRASTGPRRRTEASGNSAISV